MDQVDHISAPSELRSSSTMSSEPDATTTNSPTPADPGMHPAPEFQGPPPSYRSEASRSGSIAEGAGESQYQRDQAIMYRLWREGNPRAHLRTGSSSEKFLEEGYGASWSDPAGTARLATARNIAKVIVQDKIVPALTSFMKLVLKLVGMLLMISIGSAVIWLIPILVLTTGKEAKPTVTVPPYPGIIPPGYYTTTLGRWPN